MDLETSVFEQNMIDASFEEIQELLCKGATSVSYKVRLWGKWFFLKRPKPEFADNPKYIAAFEKEFDLGIHLDHPHIVRYHSKGHDSQGIYILTEYVDGVTLTEYIRTHPKLPKQESRQLIEQIADALRYLHARQIVHFDLKPDNILITANGHQIKLIDLGFAYSDCYSAIACGSPTYSAPEQFAVPETADLRADIFALGNVIKFITPLFPKIVQRATRPNPTERYPTVETLLRDLHPSQWRWYLLVLGVIIGGLCLSWNILHSQIQTFTTSQKDTVVIVQKVRESASEPIELADFRTAIRTAHKEAFAPYYAAFNEIDETNYTEAMQVVGGCFNRARYMEDSLRQLYFAKYPSLERDLDIIIEQEMAASMSKHQFMISAYQRERNH